MMEQSAGPLMAACAEGALNSWAPPARQGMCRGRVDQQQRSWERSQGPPRCPRGRGLDSEALSGAKGYAAPKANGSGADIIKADIYSFGVVLLVLLTGQKAFDSSRRHDDQFLVDWASPHLHNLDSLEGITDPRICGHMPPKAISALGNIILLCIKESPDLRPPIRVITDKLVKLVQSTGLQKTNAAHQLEADAQDPSFITTRPYFEPSSTASQAGTESFIPR
ncbi:hypothetical protein ACQ4PT_049928 [Festuca glaucescens]